MSPRKAQERIVYKLYAKLNSLFGDEVVIQRGIVAKRYEVNRFNVDVTHHDRNGIRLEEMRELLIADLMTDGWARADATDPRQRHNSATVLSAPVGDKRVYIYIEKVDRDFWNPTIHLNTACDR